MIKVHRIFRIIILGLFLVLLSTFSGNGNEALVEELKELNKLYQEGVLTKEEFSKSKAKVLSLNKQSQKNKKAKKKELTQTQQVAKKKDKKTKMKDVVALGTYQEFNSYPEDMLKQFGIACKIMMCRSKKAGQKVYSLFVQHGPSYHERHPGAIIHGMAWFEIMYLGKLKENKRTIERYLKEGSDNKTNSGKKLRFTSGSKKLRSLIKMNKARKKMREALGLSLNDDLAKVLKRHWLLGDFLNNDKLKVKKAKLDSSIKKRKKLLAKYQTAIKKYKEKLAEGKEEG